MLANLHTVRNLLIHGVHACRSVTGVAAGRRVIALHDIQDAGLFRERMEMIADEFEVVPVSAMAAQTVSMILHPKKTQVAVTFDDGYASWEETAAPILEELQIPAVFFTCSGFLDLSGEAHDRFCADNLKRQARPRSLSKSGLQALANHDLFEVGSHTVSHVDFSNVFDREQINNEINADRDALEDTTGQKVRWFAYPFGGRDNWTAEGRECVANAGFDAAFLAEPDSWHASSDTYGIGRDMIEPREPQAIWRKRLQGSYDPLFHFKARLRGGERYLGEDRLH